MEAITNLGIGEALISFLDGEGRPGMVEICRVLPPQSQMGPIGEGERKRAVEGNPLFVRYGASEDRESAYEVLSQESKRRENEALQAAEQERLEKEAAKTRKKQAATAGRIAKTATGTIGREIGNELGKKVGGSFGRRLGGNIGAALGRGILDTLFKF